MGADFIELTEGFFVAPQIRPADLERARDLGIRLIINNRPDGEESGQPRGTEIAAAASAAGLAYVSIPIASAADIGAPQLDAFDAATASAGRVLAFCRSGTRSAMLHSLARARAGDPPAQILADAAKAGYDLRPISPRLQQLAMMGARRDQ
jgi:uncharacterized protein (TIGR01244 family)